MPEKNTKNYKNQHPNNLSKEEYMAKMIEYNPEEEKKAEEQQKKEDRAILLLLVGFLLYIVIKCI